MRALKRIAVGLICFIPFHLFAQETELIERKSPNSNITEFYYVLSADTSIKHGAYYQLGYSYSSQKNDTLIKGFYKNNLKDSIWENYSYGSYPLSKGAYFNGEQIGVWDYYASRTQIDQKYDYTKNEILFYSETDKNKEFKVILNGDTLNTKLDRPLLYIGGISTMLGFAHKNVVYPKEAMRNSIEGKVTISFIIDSTGNPSEYQVVQGIGYGCDEETMRVVKSIPNKWIPGILNGKKVSVENQVSINYRLR